MDEGVVLGNDREGEDIVLSYEQRRQHTYVIGVNGTGKTTLLGRIALADMSDPARHGVCVIDPHGDLIQDLLARVPPDRADDVILFDPSDRDYPFALNLFAQPVGAEEIDLLASEIVGIFAKVFGAHWGPRIEDVTRNLVMTLLARPLDFQLQGDAWPAAMDEIPALLRLEKVKPEDEKLHYFKQRKDTYRSLFYQMLRDSGHLPIEEFWVWDYDTLTPRPRAELVSSVLNKVRRFLANPMMRNILAQTENRLDLTSIMDEGKILLVDLSKGKLGDDNATFLGSLLVAKLVVAIFARANTPRDQRRPFHIIVDEFQSFATSSFPILLTEARKFAVDLVIAHQYRDQLRHWVQGSTSTTGNLICFRVNGEDADDLAKEFDHSRHVPPYELQPSYIRAWNILNPKYIFAGDARSYGIRVSSFTTSDKFTPAYGAFYAREVDSLGSSADKAPFSMENPSGDPVEVGLTIYLRAYPAPTAETIERQRSLEQAQTRWPDRIRSSSWEPSVSAVRGQGRAFKLTRTQNPRYTDAYRAAANQLTQLPNYHAMCRLLSPGKHTEATVVTVDWPAVPSGDHDAANKTIHDIRTQTRRTYCRPKAKVEKELEWRYSKRLEAVGLPPLEPDQPLPEIDRTTYESDEGDD